MNEKIFKAYDVRGIYPSEINEEIVEKIAMAYAKFLSQSPMKIAVGHDVRLSSPSLKDAVIKGLTSMGVEVIDIGQGPTELIYFAVGVHNLDGGIQISASHNPADYNGLKMVRQGVEALSSDNGLMEIKELVLADNFTLATKPGSVTQQYLTPEYLKFLKQFINLGDLPSLKVVANNNFGLSGVLATKLLKELAPQVEMIGLNDQSDGSFPKGRPDPMVPENRQETSDLVVRQQANLGVAWDADGDRCFIIDELGQFVEGCHLTALLAQHLLKKNPGGKIIFDPRNIWAVEQTVKQAGGVPLINKAGHTFIKNRMKKEDAVFAGEMSGHFYFRDFFFADNGIIPFLLILSMIAETGQSVSELFRELREKFKVSGEINFKVTDTNAVIDKVEDAYQNGQIDKTDGLSVSFDDWRFNLRASNTEPLLRLNVEGFDQQVVEQKVAELKELIGN